MSEPAMHVTLVPSVLPEEPFAADPLREPLWRQLGADRCRVAVIDLQTSLPVAWRWMRDGGVSSGSGDAQPLDHVLPGAETLLDNWIAHTANEPGSVVTHMLSPRRWVYFWRSSERLGVLVQIHFLTGRSTSHAFDTAGLRVLCEHWLGDSLRAVDLPAPPSWDRVERRAVPALPRSSRILLGCIGVCLLLALWLASFGAQSLEESDAAQQREAARLTLLSNQTLQLHLVQALAGGDYGLAQEVLNLHKGIDHFAAAAVLNPRGQVVAHAGFVPSLPVGQALSPALRESTLALPLLNGGKNVGELHLMAPPVAKADAAATSQAFAWRIVGGAMAVLLIVAALFVSRPQAPSGQH